jgi:hypothetical protein
LPRLIVDPEVGAPFVAEWLPKPPVPLAACAEVTAPALAPEPAVGNDGDVPPPWLSPFADEVPLLPAAPRCAVAITIGRLAADAIDSWLSLEPQSVVRRARQAMPTASAVLRLRLPPGLLRPPPFSVALMSYAPTRPITIGNLLLQKERTSL